MGGRPFFMSFQTAFLSVSRFLSLPCHALSTMIEWDRICGMETHQVSLLLAEWVPSGKA